MKYLFIPLLAFGLFSSNLWAGESTGNGGSNSNTNSAKVKHKKLVIPAAVGAAVIINDRL